MDNQISPWTGRNWWNLTHYWIIGLAKFRTDAIPRYVRCNTNVISLSDLIASLTSSTYNFILLPNPIYPPPSQSFFLDPHLEKDLLAFPASTKFEKNEHYLNGGIILQDKASCFPAKVMMFDWNESQGDVIDGT